MEYHITGKIAGAVNKKCFQEVAQYTVTFMWQRIYSPYKYTRIRKLGRTIDKVRI